VSGGPAIGASKRAPLHNPGPTIAAARAVLEQPAAIRGPGWARSVALLARIALEDAVARFWARTEPGMQQASGKARFVALRYYVPDSDIARRAHHRWTVLSDATHYSGYHFAPTATELRAWLTDVEQLVAALAIGERPAARTSSPARLDAAAAV
jgi:hypothetical protein